MRGIVGMLCSIVFGVLALLINTPASAQISRVASTAGSLALNTQSVSIGLVVPISSEIDAPWLLAMQDTLGWHLKRLQAQTTTPGVDRIHPLLANLTIRTVDIGDATARQNVTKTVIDLMQNNGGTLAILGASYSRLTEVASFAAASGGLPICDGASTSDDFSDKTQHPTFFRTVPSDQAQAEVILRFIAIQGWKRFSMVYTDDSYGRGIYNRAMEYASTAGVELVASFTVTPDKETDYDREMNSLQNSDTTIIVFAGFYPEFIRVLKSAQGASMIGNGFAWIASDGIITTDFSAIPNNERDLLRGVINVSPTEGQGNVYQSWLSDWNKIRSDSANYPRLAQVPSTMKEPYPFTMFYVAALEHLFWGLNRALVRMNAANTATRNQLLDNLRIPSDFDFPTTTSVTGLLKLNTTTGDTLSPNYRISFFEGDSRSFTPYATLSATGNISIVGNTQLRYSGGTSTKPSDSITGSFDPVSLAFPSPISLIFFVLTGLIEVAIITVIVLVLKYQTHPVIKAASPVFCLVILGGLFIAAATPLIYVMTPPANWVCVAEMWLIPACFGIVMGTMLSKIYRVLRIFQTSISKRRTHIRNMDVLIWTSCILGLELLIAAIWTGVSPPTLENRRQNFGQFIEIQPVCISYYGGKASQTLQSTFLGIFYGYNTLILLLGVVLAYATRTVPSEFRETATLSLTIYNFLAICIFIFPISYVVPLTTAATAAMKGVAIYASVMGTLAVLFGYKFYTILIKNRGKAPAISFSTMGGKKAYEGSALSIGGSYDGAISSNGGIKLTSYKNPGQSSIGTASTGSAVDKTFNDLNPGASKSGAVYVRDRKAILSFWQHFFLSAYADKGLLILYETRAPSEPGRPARVFFFRRNASNSWKVQRKVDKVHGEDMYFFVLTRTSKRGQTEQFQMRVRDEDDLNAWVNIIERMAMGPVTIMPAAASSTSATSTVVDNDVPRTPKAPSNLYLGMFSANNTTPSPQRLTPSSSASSMTFSAATRPSASPSFGQQTLFSQNSYGQPANVANRGGIDSVNVPPPGSGARIAAAPWEASGATNNQPSWSNNQDSWRK
ncbi:periplasmic binding protein-like I [Cladochytrium replicatum]|nr:periplasmic binding protein-like I [Cladochytrium replicatum]